MLKLIVVDDEVEIKFLFETFLRKEISQNLIELHYFESGADCLNFLKSLEDIDQSYLVLSDINMPVMSGIELLAKIKDWSPTLKVKIVSAYDDEKLKNEARNLGAADYMVKPINFKDLKSELNSYIEQLKRAA